MHNKFARLLNTGIGIEVEVENVPNRLFKELAGWEIKDDASLRNEGKEFVTKFGCRLRDVFDLVTCLTGVISATKEKLPYFDFNERTSIHVHVDVRKLSPEEIKSLILLYTMYEDSLFKLAGEFRRHNIFCVPLRYIAMSDLPTDSLMNFISRCKKYCAINLLRIADFGTIEFRHMEGNYDPERIINWTIILAKLVDYCRTVNCDDIMDEIMKLKYQSHYNQFTQQIFGEHSKHIEIIPREFDMAVSDAKLFFDLRV